MVLLMNSVKRLKNTNLKFLQKMKEEGILLNPFHKASIALNLIKTLLKNGNYRPNISLMSRDVKILSIILVTKGPSLDTEFPPSIVVTTGTVEGRIYSIIKYP